MCSSRSHAVPDADRCARQDRPGQPERDALGACRGATWARRRSRCRPVGPQLLSAAAQSELPTLQDDFRKAGIVTNIYGDAAPDLAKIFDNAPTVSKTVVDEQDNLNANCWPPPVWATTPPTPSNRGGQSHRSHPTLRAPLKVVGDYSPEFGCLLKGISVAIDRFAPIIGGIRPGLFVASNFIPARRPTPTPRASRS